MATLDDILGRRRRDPLQHGLAGHGAATLRSVTATSRSSTVRRRQRCVVIQRPLGDGNKFSDVNGTTMQSTTSV